MTLANILPQVIPQCDKPWAFYFSNKIINRRYEI